MYDDAPKKDKDLAFANTCKDVRESAFFEHLKAQVKHCIEKGMDFDDLLEVGSTTGVEQEAGDTVNIE